MLASYTTRDGVSHPEAPAITKAREAARLGGALDTPEARDFVFAMLQHRAVFDAILADDAPGVNQAFGEVLRNQYLSTSEVTAALRAFDRVMGIETREVRAARAKVGQLRAELAAAEASLDELSGEAEAEGAAPLITRLLRTSDLTRW